MRLELLGVLAVLLAGPVPLLTAQSDLAETSREPGSPAGLAWKPGTLVQNQYKELAGTLILDGTHPPMVRSEGHEYVLMTELPAAENSPFKNKTAVILKGIEAVVALPGRPVQYLYWPMEGTVKLKRLVFPDPSADHWRWLVGLGSREGEGTP